MDLGFRELGAKNIYTTLSCNLSNATTELYLNLQVNLLFQEHFHLIFGIFAFDVQNSFGKKGANDIYSPPMSSIFPPRRGRFKEKLWKQMLIHSKLLLCLYENEYLVCKSQEFF